MSERTNQHYVPRFYFRNFSGDGSRIHLLLRPSDRIILNAPIKGQCIKQRLYGPAEIESSISQIEARYSRAIRNAIHTAWHPDDPRMDDECQYQLLEAVLVQRARTMHAVEKEFDDTEQVLFELFKEHLRCSPSVEGREEMIQAIEDGKITIKQDATSVVSELMLAAIKSVVLIMDLGVRLLRNRTEMPFLFGDAPVVCCNTHYRNVTARGVLGLQTPGLQIFFPLDSRTLLLLMDSCVYSTRFADRAVLDLVDPGDVSQLNALQLHHSLTSVYFGHEKDGNYVKNLWDAHRTSVVQSRSQVKMGTGRLVDGTTVDKLLHGFEPHLSLRLNLSFLNCNPIRASEYQFSHRTPQLVAEHDRICELAEKYATAQRSRGRRPPNS